MQSLSDRCSKNSELPGDRVSYSPSTFVHCFLIHDKCSVANENIFLAEIHCIAIRIFDKYEIFRFSGVELSF